MVYVRTKRAGERGFEPPDADPYARWCGRGGRTPPSTRSEGSRPGRQETEAAPQAVGPRWYGPLVEAATWTAIAVLAGAVLGTLFYLGARIDGLGGGLEARIDSLGGGLEARIDSLAARLDGRIDSLAARLDARIGAQGGEIRDLRAGFGGALDAQASEIRDLHAELGGRIDAQASEIRGLRADLTARLDEHIRRHAG